MHRYSVVIAALAPALLVFGAAAEPPEWIGKARPQVRAHRIHGSGNWKTGGKKRRPLQRWSLNVERGDDGELHGSVSIEDSALLASGHVRGSIDGQRISGTITDTSGKAAAEFRGAIAADGVRGTYTDRTGETGDWVWDGPLPE